MNDPFTSLATISFVYTWREDKNLLSISLLQFYLCQRSHYLKIVFLQIFKSVAKHFTSYSYRALNLSQSSLRRSVFLWLLAIRIFIEMLFDVVYFRRYQPLRHLFRNKLQYNTDIKKGGWWSIRRCTIYLKCNIL